MLATAPARRLAREPVERTPAPVAAATASAYTTYVTLPRNDLPAPPLALPAPLKRAALPAAVNAPQSRPSPVPKNEQPPENPAAEPERIYVFGDLHGRVDLLRRLRQAIDTDRRASPSRADLVIGLGDYIDRGPDSRTVISELVEGFDCPSVMLRGNHEQMLLDFLEQPQRKGNFWFDFGAQETLLSYGLDRKLVTGPRADFAAIRAAFVEAMPIPHLMFFQRTINHYETGGYFFAHAGARPGVALDAQDDRDLLWIRNGFADRDMPFEKVVVHGHTPVERPYLGRFRINLDTGAYATNQVACLVLAGESRRLLDI
jgi:serine/threonine protein phosphatase 1